MRPGVLMVCCGLVHPCGDLYWQWRVVVRVPRKMVLEACSTGGTHITYVDAY